MSNETVDRCTGTDFCNCEREMPDGRPPVIIERRQASGAPQLNVPSPEEEIARWTREANDARRVMVAAEAQVIQLAIRNARLAKRVAELEAEIARPSGGVEMREPIDCPACNGLGVVLNHFGYDVGCKACDGQGDTQVRDLRDELAALKAANEKLVWALQNYLARDGYGHDCPRGDCSHCTEAKEALALALARGAK